MLMQHVPAKTNQQELAFESGLGMIDALSQKLVIAFSKVAKKRLMHADSFPLWTCAVWDASYWSCTTRLRSCGILGDCLCVCVGHVVMVLNSPLSVVDVGSPPVVKRS